MPLNPIKAPKTAVLSPLALAVAGALSLPATSAFADEQEATALQAIEVTGTQSVPTSEQTESYTTETTRTATRLDLSHRETPQSVSVVTRQQIEDFQQTEVNDVLEATPGVTVQSVETDRTYYNARGFEITNFQYDGLGVPLVYQNTQGSLDTVIYDRVEILRGANGLMTGEGNPSATVNYIRKRPTEETQAYAEFLGGDFDRRRVEGDVSGALTDNVRARLVGAHDDRESHIDRYEKRDRTIYGVVEADLTDTTLLTLGHAHQSSQADSPLWGALPLYHADGSPTNFDVSTSTAADWSFWENTTDHSFAELRQGLNGGWEVRAVATRRYTDSDSRLFYQFGNPDAQTGLGMGPFPSEYVFENEQLVGDIYAAGPFDLLNRTHELVLGATYARSETEDESTFASDATQPLPPVSEFDGDYPLPTFDVPGGGSEWTDKQYAAYGAARWTITDRVTALTGLRLNWIDSEGESYGQTKERSDDAVETPYAGVIVDLTDNHSVYASYAEIFTPQTEINRTGDRLDPIEGTSIEAGLKSDLFDGRVNSTVSVFQIEQENVAQAAGTLPGTATTFFTGAEGLTSQGGELELAGEVTDRLKLSGGYAYVDVEDADNNPANTHIPEHTFKARGTYEVPKVAGLKVGAQVRWQSEIKQEQGVITVGPKAGQNAITRQDDYAVVDLMASYDLSENLTTRVNLSNVTDEKYIESLKKFGSQAQGFYGEPRAITAALRWEY